MRTRHSQSERRRTRTLDRRGGALLAAVFLLMAPPAQAQPATDAGKPFDAYRVACAPQAVRLAPSGTARLQASLMPGRRQFGPGDTLVVDAGANQDVAVDQQYYVRRVLPGMDRKSGQKELWIHVHTAGWVRITEVYPTSALATVVHACDAFESGDLLEPFVLPTVPAPMDPPGRPDYSAPGQVLFGGDRRTVSGASNFMVIDRGSDHGVKPGQRLTIFRRLAGVDGPVNPIAEATVMLVLSESATILIDRSLQGIFVGDHVALHR